MRFAAIVQASCEVYGITRAEFMGEARIARLCEARHVAAYLSVRHLGKGAKWTGRRMGRDHTTVLNSLRRAAVLPAEKIAKVLERAEEIAAATPMDEIIAHLSHKRAPISDAERVSRKLEKIEQWLEPEVGSREWFEINEARFRAGLAAAAQTHGVAA